MMARDKKVEGGRLTFILLRGIGLGSVANRTCQFLSRCSSCARRKADVDADQGPPPCAMRPMNGALSTGLKHEAAAGFLSARHLSEANADAVAAQAVMLAFASCH